MTPTPSTPHSPTPRTRRSGTPSPGTSSPGAATAAPTTVEAVIRARLSSAIGGWRGSLEAALPTVAFVIVWTATKNLNQSLLAAGAVLLVALVLCLLMRQTPRFVVTAAFATAFAAFLAKRSGNASDVFLPGLLMAGGMLALCIVTILVRWPLVGFIVAAGDPNMKDDPTGWRRSDAMVRVCSRLTWVFAALFAVRLAVMLPLYLTHHTTSLGVTKIVLGWPLYIVALGIMALLLVRGETPLAEHDALLHDDVEGRSHLEHADHVGHQDPASGEESDEQLFRRSRRS